MSASIGRYELIADIGRGGMADVKLALQRGPAGFEKLVVLKLVHAELASDPQIVDMLLGEAKLSALIKHANVVDVYELGEADGRYFIAMEYLEGEPLLAILDQGVTANKRLDPLSMARIVADTAEGLEAAHALKGRDGKPLHLVHNDISLGNIFVLYSGQVKLLDFGVANAARSAAKKQDAKVFGKLAYMAPERIDGNERKSDKRSDIWSLGCVLWEALTHKRLFKGANDIEIIREVRYVNVPPPSTVNPAVPAELDAIVMKALQRDATRRQASAKELASAIEEVLTAKAYPSKNYKIGTYMMQTFADRIAARERLLRDVAGPVRPSAEVIEAAFGDTGEKRESSLPSFDLDALLAPANQVVLPEDSTGADVAVATPEVPRPPPHVPRSAPVEAAEPVEHLEEIEPVDDDGEAPPRRRTRLPIYAAGVAAVLVVMIVVIARSCGGEREQTIAAKAADSAVDATSVATSATADPPIDAADAPAAAPIADEEIEMPVEPVAQPVEPVAQPAEDDKPKPRPKPTKSAQQLYAEGLAAWNKKDLKTAYAKFTEGRRASSRYANNWYGLGLVHEKYGRKRDARTAYERYLQLAPRAPNADKLREHIKKKLR